MRLNRFLLPTVLVVIAMVVQVSVLARLHLPGAVPDLLLLTVLGLAISYGHVAGCLIGFFAGLLADLAPPADHAVGRYALVLCVVGYAAGLAKPESGRLRTAAGPMLVVIGASVATTLLYAGVGNIVGDTAGAHVGLGKLLFTATVYDLLLAPFVVPLVMAMARHFDHDPMSEDVSGGYGGGSRGRIRTGISAPRGGLFSRSGRMVRVGSMARGARR
jgi:rod shape-determining protein MreD